MISASTPCSSFKRDLLEGIHNLLVDQFFIALYDATAVLDANTTSYITDGEIAGLGYVAGGQLLLNPQVLLDPASRRAYATFDDAIWNDSVIVARACLIYNQSKGQRAVAVINFGADYTSNHGPFHVQLPSPGPETALIRIL